MIIKCYNEKHPYLLFIDLEFNNQNLVQFSGLLFKNIDEETYQLAKSYTVYITQKVCYPFAEYTSITNNFLESNGISLEDARLGIMEDFLGDVSVDELLIISHGLKNDRLVLGNAGINLSHYRVENDDMIEKRPIDGYCTFTNARRILNRPNHLTLADLAEESGYYLHNAHNAYNDVWAEVSVFTFLKKMEAQQGELLC